MLGEQLELLVGDIHTVLADGRNDLMGDPALERLCLRLAGGDHQRIQSGFVDDCHALFPAKGINSADTLFIIIQTLNRHARIPQFQRFAHIRRYKPRLAVEVQRSHLSKGFVFKNHQFVFHRAIPFLFCYAVCSCGLVVSRS